MSSRTIGENFVSIRRAVAEKKHESSVQTNKQTEKNRHTNMNKTSCRARNLQNPSNKFDLKYNCRMKSMTKCETLLQISSGSG